MKKKTLILLISLVSLLFVSVLIFGSGRPPYGDTHSSGSCHGSAGGYTISSSTPVVNEINNKLNAIITVNATGSDLFVQAYPGAKDNDLFTILPSSNKIIDGSGDDTDPNPNSMLVIFNLTTNLDLNVTSYSYTIFIIAGNNLTGGQQFAYIEVIIGNPPRVDILSKIFNHLGLYLGLPALIFLTLGTALVLINENKFVKTHGILAGGAWILTVVNTATGIIRTPISNWFTVYPLIYQIPHIILGAIGLVAGFFSMLFGIAAERKPALISGYLTLVSWWSAFMLGWIFLNNDILLLL